ncbi:citrate/2-methylcitrate synthase [Streptomyces sp. NPDC093018]|uniref:citrate/2-methylcitrate synthase n=1 Tax=Streptomyces sp. NPDC093018 TaxID=3155067 RepID=UPI0034249342
MSVEESGMDDGMWLTTEQAARRLGVKRETIYAYTSRGLLRRASDGARGSRFRRDDIERLAARGRKTREREGSRAVLESSIALIRNDRLFYRGYDVLLLCRGMGFENVSHLLWGASVEALPAVPRAWAFPQEWRAIAEADRDRFPLPLDRIVSGLAALSGSGHRSVIEEDCTVEAQRIIAYAVYCATGVLPVEHGGVAGALAKGLLPASERAVMPPALVSLVDVALNLAAENGLAAPTVCSRIVASVGGDMKAAVLAGLCAMRGTAPGAAAYRVEELLGRYYENPGCAQVAKLIASDRPVPGIGHLAFRQRDPRAAILLERMAAEWPPDAELPAGGALRMAALREALADIREAGLVPVNLDFAVSALCFVAGMSPGAGEALFSIARISGWVAHLLEQLAQNTNFRMQFVYTGPVLRGSNG